MHQTRVSRHNEVSARPKGKVYTQRGKCVSDYFDSQTSFAKHSYFLSHPEGPILIINSCRFVFVCTFVAFNRVPVSGFPVLCASFISQKYAIIFVFPYQKGGGPDCFPPQAGVWGIPVAFLVVNISVTKQGFARQIVIFLQFLTLRRGFGFLRITTNSVLWWVHLSDNFFSISLLCELGGTFWWLRCGFDHLCSPHPAITPVVVVVW